MLEKQFNESFNNFFGDVITDADNIMVESVVDGRTSIINGVKITKTHGRWVVNNRIFSNSKEVVSYIHKGGIK